MGSSCSTNSKISIFPIPYVAVLTSVCSEAGERSPVYFSLIIVSVSVSRLTQEGVMKVSKILWLKLGRNPASHINLGFCSQATGMILVTKLLC